MNKDEEAQKKLTEGLPLVARQLCLEAMRLFTDQIDQGMTKKRFNQQPTESNDILL